MADERYSFSQARTRLEEIVTQVRKKDTSLEKSLDLLEEGVRLANVCTELSDHTEWRTVVEEQAAQEDSSAGDGDQVPASGESAVAESDSIAVADPTPDAGPDASEVGELSDDASEPSDVAEDGAESA